MKNLHSLGLSISIALFLSACGGGGSSTTVSTNTTTTTTASKPALKQAASNAELESLIKQQMLEIYGTVGSNIYPIVYATAANGAPTAIADTSKSVSSTNTQETNVDEADRIKTDGTYLYTIGTAANNTVYPMVIPLAVDTTMTTAATTSAVVPEANLPKVRIFKTDQASATLAKEMPLGSDTNAMLTGLYLDTDNKKLAALAEEQQMYSIWGRWFMPSFWQNQQSQMYLLNVANPAAPTQTAKLTVDGQVISSRRIGSTLYWQPAIPPALVGLNLTRLPKLKPPPTVL